MLIHHFGAETQGFQGLIDQNDQRKALVPEKSHFLKETFFEGVLAFLLIPAEGHKKLNANPLRKYFCFLSLLQETRGTQLFVKYIEI